MLALNLTTSAMGTAVGLRTTQRRHHRPIPTLPMWRPAVLVGRSMTDLFTAIICTAFVAGPDSWWAGVPNADPLHPRRFRDLLALQLRPLWGCACLGSSPRARVGPGIGLVILFRGHRLERARATAHMPTALRSFANWNPVSAVTAAARQLFGNPNPSALVRVAHATPMMLRCCGGAVLLAIFAPLAASSIDSHDGLS